MNKKFYILSASIIAITVLVGCSRKKDKFINRNMHALATKYNILYNGELALEDGKEQLKTTYKDNYWEILPVERMVVKEDEMLPGANKNENFERAEEKATKAIQKHSMNIDGEEKNSQIDEAYVLLGESRYYDQRFIPAMEAFNYVLKNYPESSKIVEAKVWREKVNLRLDNDELALQNLKKLFKTEIVEKQQLADAEATMAEAYIKLEQYDSAITELNIATKFTRNNEEKGRYFYIIGQLYNALGEKDSANLAFDKVIDLNRRSPRSYMIHAHLEKIKNAPNDVEAKLAVARLLKKMEKNRENRPYLDYIFHQFAEYHLANDSLNLAKIYYNKSLRRRSADKYLNALNYEKLGTMHFDDAQYKTAGAYYDSTLLNLNINTKFARAVKKKRDNLNDVIYYEDIAQTNDSILTVVAMSDAEKTAYFNSLIEALRKKKEEEAEQQEIEQLIAANNNGGPTSGIVSGPSNNSGGFYFYNDVTLAYGKNEFRRIWGDRKLQDDWRLSDKQTLADEEVQQGNNEVATKATEDQKLFLDYYVNNTPTDQKIIDSIAKERNFAYYQLGLIYKEKFKEYQLAANRLEFLLKNNPEERLVLPGYYNLYRIYEIIDPSKAATVKATLIAKYPDSRYAQVLQNPEAILADDQNSPEANYAMLYQAFEDGEYLTIKNTIDDYITAYTGLEIVPKLEMLKATNIGRLQGVAAYKEALNYVALNYPSSDEGKEAQQLIKDVIPALEASKFEMPIEEQSNDWKIIVDFNSIEDPQTTVTQLQEIAKEEEFQNMQLSTSKDVYTEQVSFFTIHGFNSAEKALTFALQLFAESKANADVITTENYKVVQLQKNIEAYQKEKDKFIPKTK